MAFVFVAIEHSKTGSDAGGYSIWCVDMQAHQDKLAMTGVQTLPLTYLLEAQQVTRYIVATVLKKCRQGKLEEQSPRPSGHSESSNFEGLPLPSPPPVFQPPTRAFLYSIHTPLCT